MSERKKTVRPGSRPKPAAIIEPMAVIDIGSTAIRMTIATADASGSLHAIESLQQSVSIGNDTFRKGFIEKSTIDECVRALRHFSRVLKEHGFEDDRYVKVVATTAVREAANREAFRHRIRIACGWHIQILDLADIARLTYMGVRPFLFLKDFGAGSDLLIVEMGGGTTEVCFIGKGGSAFSQTFTLGSLRLRQLIDDVHLPMARQLSLIVQHTKRAVDQIAASLDKKYDFILVGLGGDMRFAASELAPDWDGTAPITLQVAELAGYAEKTLALPLEKLIRKTRLPFAEAETIGPALLFYTRLAQRLGKKGLVVASTSMRDGLLMEMIHYNDGDERFRKSILGSAEALARKYRADGAHAKHVARLAARLFDALSPEYRLKPRESLLLKVAALLHDIGLFIGPRNHHKHSMYLIQHSDLFGLNNHDIELVALIARYHRRSAPKPSHIEYMALEFNDRITVAKLGAILRIADALDETHTGRITGVSCEISGNDFIITTPGISDVSREELALRNKGPFFEDTYGLHPLLRAEGQS
jgi:exopolyphosphatase/guanosine-5'-triphosphate,3'-diphosphate pyrophosphatase